MQCLFASRQQKMACIIRFFKVKNRPNIFEKVAILLQSHFVFCLLTSKLSQHLKPN